MYLNNFRRGTYRYCLVDNMYGAEQNFNSDDSDDDIEETSLDSDGTADRGIYDDPCSVVVQKLLKIDQEEFYDCAVFIPINKFEKFKENMQDVGYPLLDEHIWDYDLRIGDTVKPVKLIWLPELQKEEEICLPRETKYAFAFLHRIYLSHMDKPLLNPRRTFIQVNLVLDYHRTQKRRRGIEIFSVCDLIAFKMAIDDSRLEYENCEFHKIINRTLAEYVQSGTYMKDGKFDVREYMGFTQDYRDQIYEIFQYLVYHFQKIIGSIYWENDRVYPIQLSNITNISAFLERINVARHTLTILVRETDSSGKYSEILYEILTNAEKLKIIFDLDDEWIYSRDFILNNETRVLDKIDITLDTKNSFNFIENFISWLKFVFGKRTKRVNLCLKNFEKIHPYVFHGFHLNGLAISGKLDYKLVKMLQTCNYCMIFLYDCRIENDIKENFGLIGHPTGSDRNVFRFLDNRNIDTIQLILEEHTIGTLFAYVASIMTEKKLFEFQFTKMLYFPVKKWWTEIRPLFRRSDLNHVIEQIEVYSDLGERIDLYELLNDVDPIDREEFDFYQ